MEWNAAYSIMASGSHQATHEWQISMSMQTVWSIFLFCLLQTIGLSRGLNNKYLLLEITRDNDGWEGNTWLRSYQNGFTKVGMAMAKKWTNQLMSFFSFLVKRCVSVIATEMYWGMSCVSDVISIDQCRLISLLSVEHLISIMQKDDDCYWSRLYPIGGMDVWSMMFAEERSGCSHPELETNLSSKSCLCAEGAPSQSIPNGDHSTR